MRRLAAGLGCAALVAGAGYGSYWMTYTRAAGELEATRSDFAGRIADRDDEMSNDRRVVRELEEWGAGALGASRETVEHRFRTGLHALATQAGLESGKLVINCGTPAGARNPAVAERVEEFRRRSELTDPPDWFEVEGEIRGEGSYRAVLTAVALAQSQAWIARVSDVAIRPADETREVYELRLGVRTAFAPDLMDAEPPGDPPVAPADAGLLAAVERCVAGNLFREPAPPPAPADPPPAAQAPAPSQPAPPPTHEWRLTGVSESGQGPLAWVVYAGGQTRFVGVGEGVAGLTLVAVEDDRAIFTDGERETAVPIGQTLDRGRRR